MQSVADVEDDGAPVSAAHDQMLLLRASLPVRFGGLGLRPVS